LPLRYGEFGVCTRNEPSALSSIMRIRAFTQDDAQYFAPRSRSSRRSRHSRLCCKRSTQTSAHRRRLQTRDAPSERVGADELWDKAERALRASLDSSGLTYDVLPGEGAFYGPKIEYHLKDSIGRSWQCGTMQVDFSMPGLLGAEYVARTTRAGCR